MGDMADMDDMDENNENFGRPVFPHGRKKKNYSSSCLFYQDEMEILIRPDHSFYRHGFTKKKRLSTSWKSSFSRYTVEFRV